MNRNHLPTCLLFLLSLLLASCEATTEPAHPNIIFILADDMGYGDPGAYNPHSKIPTPYMDQLAAEGMLFTDAHSTSGVCTPTRYALLTGQYAWRTSLKKGVTRGYSKSLMDPSRLNVASMLKQKGYQTAIIGKWHLGLGDTEPLDYSQPYNPGPNQLGFDYFFGIPASLDMVPYVYVENDRVIEMPTDSVGPSGYEYGGPYWRAGPIAPSFRHIDVMPAITEKAVSFIEEQQVNTPFFLYFPLSAPHTPWLPTADFDGSSEAGMYGDFTVQVDWTIGQVMDALDRLNMTDNTLIIVASDNGSFWIEEDIQRYDHLSNLNWRGIKADIYEGGNRVPFIARWPARIAPGTQSDQTISLVDFMATVAEIVDIELPNDAAEDSFNLLPILTSNTAEPVRQDVILHSSEGMFALRQGEWKFIEGLGSGGFTRPVFVEPEANGPTGQLYNLATDPAESVNLFMEEPEKVEAMQSLLDRYREQGYSRPMP